MPDQIYPAAKSKMLQGEIDWLTDPIVAVLIGTESYTYSPNHASFADVAVAARVAVSGTLTGRTVSDSAVVDADDVTFSAVLGDPANALMLVKYTGSDAASPLIAYLDEAVGLPVTPTGADIKVTWSNGSTKIFVL